MISNNRTYTYIFFDTCRNKSLADSIKKRFQALGYKCECDSSNFEHNNIAVDLRTGEILTCCDLIYAKKEKNSLEGNLNILFYTTEYQYSHPIIIDGQTVIFYDNQVLIGNTYIGKEKIKQIYDRFYN